MSKLQTYIPVATRRAVLQEHDARCFICGDARRLDLHHVTPEYAGGPTVVENLMPLCSNKLGGNACHTLVHAAYRTKERTSGGGPLSGDQYMSLVTGLKALIGA